jgi:hypothetical protein
LAACLSENGLGEWFELDRSGRGHCAPSTALVSLLRDPDGELREIARRALAALTALGIAGETSVLDLLLSAPTSPTERTFLALRASKALGAGGGTSLSAWLPLTSGYPGLDEPPADPAALAVALKSGDLDPLLARLGTHHRARLRAWLEAALARAPGEPRLALLVESLVETLGPLLALPLGGLVGPPDPAGEIVVRGLGLGLGAQGDGQGVEAGLADMFRLFGGKFVTDARHPTELEGEPPPAHRLERWRWFCAEAAAAAAGADVLWRQVIDPVQ